MARAERWHKAMTTESDDCQRRAVPLAGKSYVWPEEEIDAWLENTRAMRARR